MSEFERQVVNFFDKCPTRNQIRSLALMYSVPEAQIIDVLKAFNREIPPKEKRPQPKCKGLKADLVIIDENATKKPKSVIKKAETIIKIPDCVIVTIEKRMHELENDIKNYQNTIKNYQDMVQKLESEYKAHADYLMHCPFEQGNLSHSCSDDKAESPQADA